MTDAHVAVLRALAKGLTLYRAEIASGARERWSLRDVPFGGARTPVLAEIAYALLHAGWIAPTDAKPRYYLTPYTLTSTGHKALGT